ALHRTCLYHSVTFMALALLQRLKTRFSTARVSTRHSRFHSAPSKVVCDDAYSDKSRTRVGQGMFALREICAYLEW
ncbi:hypothetical protein BD410DRAFT_679199, partial [Rickenella mellea]